MDRLNDNEVKEVAKMQQKIDSYEGFIAACFMMMLSKKEINYPKFTGTCLNKEMNEIWRWIKERKAYQTIWHDASEEPQIEKDNLILAEYKKGWFNVLDVINDGILFSALDNDNEYLKNIKRWCYINEIKDK